MLADLAGRHGAGCERGQQAGLALLAAQGPAAVGAVVLLGEEVDLRRSAAEEGGASDPVAGPAGLAGLFQQQGQRTPDPPFWPSSSSSKRSKTACTWGRPMGGEWFCRRRATSPGSAPGWRTSTSSTSMMSCGSRGGGQPGRLAFGEALPAGPQLAVSGGAVGEIDVDAAEALAAGAVLTDGGEQERVGRGPAGGSGVRGRCSRPRIR